VDLSQLAVESVIVLLIRDAQQQAVGCGAIVLGRWGWRDEAGVYRPGIAGNSWANGCWRRWKRKRCAGTAIPCGWRPDPSAGGGQVVYPLGLSDPQRLRRINPIR
jgi:hypothetical protein